MGSADACSSSVHLVCCRARIPTARYAPRKSAIGATCYRRCHAASTNGCRAWLRKVWWARMRSSPVSARPSKSSPAIPESRKPAARQKTLKEYLEQVWAGVAKEALKIIFPGADTAGFEEDVRVTAMWLGTLNAGNTNGESTEKEKRERRVRRRREKGKSHRLRPRI